MVDEFQMFAADVIRAIDAPNSLAVLDCISTGNLVGLKQITVEASSFETDEDYFRHHQTVELLRKLQPSGSDAAAKRNQLRATALEKWWEAEKSCFLTNSRLNHVLTGYPYPDQREVEFFRLVKKHVTKLIGSYPPALQGRFGPGASFEHRGTRSLIPDKLSCYPELTKNAFPFCSAFLIQHQSWARAVDGTLFSGKIVPQGTFKLVKGNRYATVPKDSGTDRSIGVEPTLNLWYQLGAGEAMRRALQRRRFLLPEGRSEEHHKRMARQGSVRGDLATIDLSSASDTICTSLVELCLPSPWLALLADLRSPFTEVDSHPVKLEKFSSMGCGFTFELETALFAGIAYACAEICDTQLVVNENFGVYGDDIIVPTELYDFLSLCLRYCGFTPNRRKSFNTGPFRESCGGDFFNGIDVRPVYLKKVPTQPAEWFPVLNAVGTLCDRFPALKKVLASWRMKVLPLAYRNCFGPRDLGDIVLWNDDPETWNRRRILSSSGKLPNDWMAIRAVIPEPERIPIERWDEQTAVAAMLYSVGLSAGVTPRGSPKQYRVKWVAFG